MLSRLLQTYMFPAAAQAGLQKHFIYGYLRWLRPGSWHVLAQLPACLALAGLYEAANPIQSLLMLRQHKFGRCRQRSALGLGRQSRYSGHPRQSRSVSRFSGHPGQSRYSGPRAVSGPWAVTVLGSRDSLEQSLPKSLRVSPVFYHVRARDARVSSCGEVQR